MALVSPLGTDTLLSQDHARLHRVVDVDEAAPEGSLIVDQDGNVVIAEEISASNISGENTGDQDISLFELEFARKVGNNLYMEYVTTGENITQVNYWTNSGKLTKLFTKDITYSGSNPTSVVIEDEITGDVMTTTIAYSGDTVTSVTKVMT